MKVYKIERIEETEREEIQSVAVIAYTEADAFRMTTKYWERKEVTIKLITEPGIVSMSIRDSVI